MKISLLLLGFTPLIAAFPWAKPTSAAAPQELSARYDTQLPRLAMYVQTFHDAQNGSLSLLPLVQQNTGVTHVIISSFHIQSQPGDIHLNNDPPNSTSYDQLVCIFVIF
jgi:hypothetical protein